MNCSNRKTSYLFYKIYMIGSNKEVYQQLKDFRLYLHVLECYWDAGERNKVCKKWSWVKINIMHEMSTFSISFAMPIRIQRQMKVIIIFTYRILNGKSFFFLNLFFIHNWVKELQYIVILSKQVFDVSIQILNVIHNEHGKSVDKSGIYIYT